MNNQEIIENKSTQQFSQNPIDKPLQIPAKPKVNYWMIFSVSLLIILLLTGIWLVLYKNNKIYSNKQTAITNYKDQEKNTTDLPNYIFQTFVRGKVCAFQIGSDPNTLDPFCRYWQVNSITKKIEELPVNHPYFKQIYTQQRKANESFQRGVGTDSEDEEIRIKDASQDNENKFLYTIDSKNNLPTSAWIRTIDTNNKEKIIEDINSTGCEGQISSWSENSGDILFTSQWDGTPKSPSGDMLKSLCVYNYKTKKLIYKKLLPVDVYSSHTDDMVQGRISLLNDLVINYRKNTEEHLPNIENSTIIYDQNGKIFQNNLILIKSEMPDKFILLIYDLTSKKLSSQIIIPRLLGVDEYNPPNSDTLDIVKISNDKKHIMVVSNPKNSTNTPSIATCFYDLDIINSSLQKVACGYQFQLLYPGMEASNFDQFIYADFLDWYF